MPQEYGLNVLTKTGRDVRVIADGNYARFKSGGITLDAAVLPTNGLPAAPSAPTLTGSTTGGAVAANTYYFVVTYIDATGETAASSQTSVTTTGTTSTVTVTSPVPAVGASGYNVYAGTTNGSAWKYQGTAAIGTPFVQATTPGTTTAVAPSSATASGNLVLIDDTIVAAGQAYMRFGQVITRNTTTGLYGPYDPGASDGRQTLTRGQCFILNKTWVDVVAGSPFLIPFQGTAHPAVFDGGRAWLDRIIQAGSGTHTLAAGPTLAELLAAFPEVSFVKY